MAYLLPSVRSASYENFFGVPASSSQMEGCYAWCRFISSNLFLIIGDLEVIVRNQIHRSMSLYHSNNASEGTDWLIDAATINHIFSEYRKYRKPNLSKIKQSAEYLIKTNPFLDKKCNSMVLDCVIYFIKKNNRKPTLDDIVASLNFGFWVQCLYSLTLPVNSINLARVLNLLFPYNTGSFDLTFLKQQLDTMYRVKNIRNRISHQDSILRTPESNYPHQEFIPKNPNQLINSLSKLLSLIENLVFCLDSIQGTNLKTAPYWNLLGVILDANTLESFKKSGGCYTAFLLPVLLNQFNSTHNVNYRIQI